MRHHGAVKRAWGMWLVVAYLVFGCHGNAASDAGTSAPEAAQAGPVAPLLQATLVELRDSTDTEGERHDVVLRLEREGAEFAWTAKVSRFDASLGERVPDTFLRRGAYDKPCACEVESRCPCESYGTWPPEVKRGRVASSVVDALLAACAGQPLAPPEADAGTRHGTMPRRHVSAWAATTGEVRHFSSSQGDATWLANGQPLASDGAAIDAAFGKLLTEVGVPTWVSTLNYTSPMTLPPGFSELDKAQILEVNDQWNGLGRTHHVFLRLERKGAGFAWKAKVASYAGSLGERVPDPYTPPDRNHSEAPCLCGVEDKCECEQVRDVKKKSGTVAAAPVEAFLAAVATHDVDTSHTGPHGRMWTDDYPKGHVVVWSAPGADPIHLTFLDQQRRWRANGHELTLDPGDGTGGGFARGSHVKLNATYHAMLKAIGLDKWIDELHPRGR
jgi:hypothetical protein